MKAKVGLVVQAAAPSQEMHSLIKGSKLVILPHSGHMTFIDQRVLFHETAEGFLPPEAK
jgi:pimeloyl-ACP methyl ester carboxylesterase